MTYMFLHSSIQVMSLLCHLLWHLFALATAAFEHFLIHIPPFFGRDTEKGGEIIEEAFTVKFTKFEIT